MVVLVVGTVGKKVKFKAVDRGLDAKLPKGIDPISPLSGAGLGCLDHTYVRVSLCPLV